MTFEDRIRETIKSSEAQLFDARYELLKYHRIHPGKLLPDARYMSKIHELQDQETALMNRISANEGALDQAAKISSKIPGCNSREPLTWLQNRQKQLQAEISRYRTDITLLKQKIEQNKDTAPSPAWIDLKGKTHAESDPVAPLRLQLTEIEQQFAASGLETQLADVQKVLPEIEKIFREVS